MEYFAKMIYEQWINSQDAEGYNWGDYDEAWERVYDILNGKLASEIERSVNKKVWDVQEKAFIAGFSYACKCLSNGKINLKGGVDNE